METSQSTHSLRSSLERVPPGHKLQLEEAEGEDEPASHAVQDAAPPVLYVPASQLSQAVRSSLERVPPGHAEQSTDPAPEKCPASHGAHELEPTWSANLREADERLDKCDLGRAKAQLARTHSPAPHAVHNEAPSLSECVPGTHMAHMA